MVVNKVQHTSKHKESKLLNYISKISDISKTSITSNGCKKSSISHAVELANLPLGLSCSLGRQDPKAGKCPFHTAGNQYV